jgi:DegV family protein with EDD domain
MNTAIVTDSTADIPGELAAQHNITIIPAILVIEGKSLEDGKGITRREFYNRMPDMQTPPTTATPSAGSFQSLYEQLFQKGYQAVLSIHIASLLSGIYNTAKTASQAFNNRVTVVDSEQLSLGLGYQVLTAAKAAANGLPIEDIIEEIRQVRERVRVVAMLDTLEFVHRSGRVSWVRARIGSLMNIKPLLEIKAGKVLSLGQVRTRTRGVKALIDLYHKTGEIENLSILHTNAEEDARQLLSRLNTTLPDPPFLVNVTTIVGSHIGPNALGFAVLRK